MRYREMGFGTEDQDDAELRSIIQRATLSVDRYLGVPMVPQRFSFRGGTMVGEEHDFYQGNGVNEGPTYRFWTRAKPLKSVQQLRIYVTNSQYIDVAPEDLFVAHDHIQVLTMSLNWSYGIWGAFNTPLVGLVQPIARIDYTYGYSFTTVDEYLSKTDGLTWRAENQFWDASAVTVKVNGVAVTTGFTVNKEEGIVVFGAALPAGSTVQASYGYPLIPEIPQAVGMSVADFIGNKQLVEKGMTGVQSLRVGDIAIERPRPRAESSNISMDLPDSAKQLLRGLEFWTVR